MSAVNQGEEGFVIRIDTALEGIFATTNFVLENLIKLGAKEALAPADVAWIRRHLALIDHFSAETGGIREHQAEHVLQKSDLKALMKEAHEIGEEMIAKMKVDPNVNAEELPVEESWFPEGLDPALRPAYNELLDVVVAFDTLKNKPYIRHQDVGRIQNKLSELEEMLKIGPTHGLIEVGEAALRDMFEEVHDMVYSVVQDLPLETYEEPEVASSLEPLKHRLEMVIHQLKELSKKPTKWVTSKDVGHIQCQLMEIDEKYKQGRFDWKRQVPQGQAVLADLLETAHALAADLMSHAKEYHELESRLSPFIHKLNGLVEELKKFQQKPPAQVTMQELGHLQAKLSHFDDRYHETKFVVCGEIPQGQAYASELLNKAHAIVKSIQDSMHDFDYGQMDPSLKTLDSRLDRVISRLQTLRLRPLEDMSLREIARVQNELHRIDELYREGKFENWISKADASRGHAFISEKLDYAHTIAHDLVCKLPMEESEQIDPSLCKLSENLDALTAQLLKLRSQKYTAVDVGRVQNRLASIDQKYHEGGKFVHAGKIPKGQAILSEKLATAREVVHNMLCSIDE